MPEQPVCLKCGIQYVRTSGNQKFCPDCKLESHQKNVVDVPPAPDPVVEVPVKPKGIITRVDGSLEVVAEHLMELSGVKKMELVYDTIKITIERI